ASFQDDLSFCICQVAHGELQLFQAVSHQVCLDHICLFLHSLADVRNEDVVAVLKAQVLMILFCKKRKHTPVDKVGAVSLCSVLDSDIGPAAQHLLAGRSLLSCGSVSRLHSEDSAAHADISLAHFRVCLLDLCHDRL